MLRLSFRYLPAASVLVLASMLAACGSGGSTNESTSDVAAPTVAFTSHSDNQTITGGNREVTVQWTVADDVAVTGVSYSLNGGTAVPVTGSGANYSVAITLADNANVLVVNATDGAGHTGSRTLHLAYPFVGLNDGQAAAVAIGQTDFTSSLANQGGTTGRNTLEYAYGNPTFANGMLLLNDSDNYRLLGFNALPTTNGANADFVWGQVDFAGTLSGLSSDGVAADRLSRPSTIQMVDGRLFVLDETRILIWNKIPPATSGYIAPDVILGQPDATSSGSTCSRTSFFAEGFFVTGTKIIVSDANCSRVLIWNQIPGANNQPADLVLGQADFTSGNSNRGGAPAANTLSDPYGVWSDGVRLYVAEWSNNRVLIWNTFPTANGQAADHVLGQSSMSGNSGGTAANQFNAPYMLASNGNQLFMVDSGNHRVLVWDSLPAADNVPADHVIGQTDFTSGGAAATRTGFAWASGLVVTDSALVVMDGSAHRALVFQGQ